MVASSIEKLRMKKRFREEGVIRILSEVGTPWGADQRYVPEG